MYIRQFQLDFQNGLVTCMLILKFVCFQRNYHIYFHFYFFLWLLRYDHNKGLDYYNLEFIKDALLTQVRVWRFLKKKLNENKQFTFFWALYLSTNERWQKSYSRLWTLDLSDSRSLAASFVALDKPNASQQSPLSSLEGEDGIGNKPLFACFCNTWQAEKIKKILFCLWTSMELRDLRCLAAAVVALDKPNASWKIPFFAFGRRGRHWK